MPIDHTSTLNELDVAAKDLGTTADDLLKIAKHNLVTPEILDFVAKHGNNDHHNPDVATNIDLVIANNNKTTEETLDYISNQTHQVNVYIAIIKNENVSEEIFKYLANIPTVTDDVLVEIASRTKNPETLQLISKHGSVDKPTRLAIAKNEHADQDTITQVFNDTQNDGTPENINTLVAIVKHPNVDPAHLTALAQDNHTRADVLQAIAEQNNANDADIVRHPTTTLDTLTIIAQHTKDFAVATDIVKHKNARNSDFLKEFLTQVAKAEKIAQKSLVDEAFLHAVTEHAIALKDNDLYKLLIANPTTAEADLTTIFDNSDDDSITVAIVKHKHANDALLEHIANQYDDNLNVFKAILENKAPLAVANEDTLSYIREQNDDKLNDKSLYIALASHPNTKTDDLQEIADNTNVFEVLEAISTNSNAKSDMDIMEKVTEKRPTLLTQYQQQQKQKQIQETAKKVDLGRKKGAF